MTGVDRSFKLHNTTYIAWQDEIEWRVDRPDRGERPPLQVADEVLTKLGTLLKVNRNPLLRNAADFSKVRPAQAGGSSFTRLPRPGG